MTKTALKLEDEPALVWKPSRYSAAQFADTGGQGRYIVERIGGAYSLRLDGRHIGFFDSLDAAKAWAEAGARAAATFADALTNKDPIGQ